MFYLFKNLLPAIVLGLFIANAHAINKGIEFVHEQGEGRLKNVNQMYRMEVMSNLHVPKGVFVSLITDSPFFSEYGSQNERFVVDLYKIIYDINERADLEISTSGANQNIDLIVVGAAHQIDRVRRTLQQQIGAENALAHFKAVVSDYFTDRWFQDWGEFVGYGLNAYGETVHGIYYVNRDRGMKKLLQEISKMMDIGFITSDSKAGISGDYGGNIDVSPDGIFMYGNTMHPKQINQFRAYGYLGKELAVNTEWLTVGHFDEIFQFIPSTVTAKYPDNHYGPRPNYALLAADPVYGLQTIYNRPAEEDSQYISWASPQFTTPETAYFVGGIKAAVPFFLTNDVREFTLADTDAERGIQECIANPDLVPYCYMVYYNLLVSQTIEQNISLIQNKTPIINDQVVRVPQLYRYEQTEAGLVGVSLLPGTANSIVLRDYIIVPDPAYTPFKEIIEKNLNDSLGGSTRNSKVYFIDDYAEYHDMYGEIHCATNVLRAPILLDKIERPIIRLPKFLQR